MADQFKAIDEDQWYIKINLPKELQPEVDRYRQRIKDLPLKERKVLRAQFKSYLMEYFEKENKELFDKGKKKISQKLDQFLDFFDHVPPPDMDRHIPDKNTPLQEVEIHHPIGIHCINYRSFKDWDNMDLKFFGEFFEDIHTPSYISQRDKVMGRNLYEVAKNNPRSLTLSYNGALHFSKNIDGLPRETTLAEELDGYGIKFKLGGRKASELNDLWDGKTYEEKAKEIREQASLLEEGLEAKNKESYINLNLNLYQDKQRYLSLDLDRYRQRDRGGYGR
ncbi:hypothetical protein EM20IM_05105 [Candidatus Methylacidiphilum infernorum]|uniref:Uncharacterized protein n=1 Tax=Candidatus Methylacidiphilum infernorum TaxID=511746 RepID=A0ABX7PYG1_9BACT|nr:hypothetical protein EM20IM_05105 [Candidatus Methylacidiphilum infernorum]